MFLCYKRGGTLTRSCEEVENSGGHPKHKVSEFGHMFQRDDVELQSEKSILICVHFLQMCQGNDIIHGSVPFVGKLKRVQCIRENRCIFSTALHAVHWFHHSWRGE